MEFTEKAEYAQHPLARCSPPNRSAIKDKAKFRMLLKIIFLSSAAALVVMAIFCNAIYDWGTACARSWGWDRIVRTRERMKHWALPFSQILLIILAISCLIAVISF